MAKKVVVILAGCGRTAGGAARIGGMAEGVDAAVRAEVERA
jgi:hypothetical protein